MAENNETEEGITRAELFECISDLAALLKNSPEEGRELEAMMLDEAARLKCATEFKSELKAAIAAQKTARMAEEAARSGRTEIYVHEPNESNLVIQKIGERVADKRLAFTFGSGDAVIVQQTYSTYGRITERDAHGEIVRDEAGEPVTSPARVCRAVKMKNALAHNVALEVCVLVKPGKRGPVSAGMPDGMPGRMAAAWPSLLPPLRGIASNPVWYAGDLLFGDGYHEKTNLFLKSDDIEIAEFDDPKTAFEFLRDEWLCDFPFASDSDLATALMLPASVLMSRTVLGDAMGPPLFLFTAPNAGTGKTLLASVLVACVIGELPPSMGYPEDEAEREKRIGAAIMEGWPAMLLDNLRSGSFLGYGDVTLTKLVTDVIYSGRILGLSQTYSGLAGLVPICTGNNVVVDGDLGRRVLECRLEAPADTNLALRSFRHDSLVRWTFENRCRILGALRCILQVKSRHKKIVGTFPEWSRAAAYPILDVMDLDPMVVFSSWVEAAENDAKGLQMKGVGALLQAISSLPGISKVVDLKASDWFTPAEILAGLEGAGAWHVLDPLSPGDFVMDSTRLAHLLKRNVGSVYETAEGVFRLQSARMHLGERTSRKVRPVYRVARSEVAKPPAPKSKSQEQDEIRAKMKARKKDDDENA